MIRNATFALVLIAAAFAGGALMNGPGLAWVRKTIGAGPSIIVDGEGETAAAPARPKRFPTAKSDPFHAMVTRQAADPRKAATGRDLASAEPQFAPESPSTPAAALIQIPGAPAAEPPAMPAPSALALADRPPSPNASPLPPLELPLEVVPTKSDPVARLVSNSQGAAAAPPEGIPPEVAPPIAPSPEPAPTASPSPSGWAEIRRKLKGLGVTRYRIESETDGRVRFSCVIPVVGLRAVAHHFEAEGDDEPQAAEAVLRRVALWRATEGK